MSAQGTGRVKTRYTANFTVILLLINALSARIADTNFPLNCERKFLKRLMARYMLQD